MRAKHWIRWALARTTIRGGYVAGTVLRRPKLRMHGLRDAAERAFAHGRYRRAARCAKELLALAQRFPDDWDCGNAVHHGHLLLGRLALLKGEWATAASELLAAGRTPGSPQLNTFGPNCRLALDLLRLGHTAPVLEFLEQCGAFWKMDAGRLRQWVAEINAGGVPDFGPNLAY